LWEELITDCLAEGSKFVTLDLQQQVTSVDTFLRGIARDIP